MSRIAPVEYDGASPEVKREFDDQIGRHGRITNMKRTLLHSGPAFHALMEWYVLRDQLLGFIGERELNLFAHAISVGNHCLICTTFFRKILIDSGDDPDNPALSDRETTLMDFARQCVANPTDVDDALYARLQAHFTDPQIVDLTAFAGLMIATNLINNALRVDLDDYLIDYTKK
jgi:alkylhydroperoxidase family enzyme